MSMNPALDRLAETPVLRIEAWVDPVVEALGYALRDPYVELYLGCSIGPTSLMLLRRVGLGFAERPEGFDLDVAETAKALGVGAGLSRNSPFWRSVGRLVFWDLAQIRGDHTLAVRRSVAPLPQRLVRRLPPSLQRSHALTAARRERPDRSPTTAVS